MPSVSPASQSQIRRALPGVVASASSNRPTCGGRTRTTVRPLTAEERRSEIARMLSGAKVTEASLQNAEQLLRTNA